MDAVRQLSAAVRDVQGQLHPAQQARRALFLDVDGTLLKIALGPGAVRVPARTRLALQTALLREQGAVALVSGRRLVELDGLFAPLRLPLIAIHGLEWRDAMGRSDAVDVAHDALRAARLRLSRLAGAHAGLELEDKGRALTVHFRLAPHLQSSVRGLMQELASEHAPLHLQAGKHCLELRPAPHAQRQAIEAFMRSAPFAGRLPVYIGDDDTDEQGFATINALGGLSIRVGNRPGTAARWLFPNVNAVVRWLMAPQQMGGRAITS